jgi:hypothetical protein
MKLLLLLLVSLNANAVEDNSLSDYDKELLQKASILSPVETNSSTKEWPACINDIPNYVEPQVHITKSTFWSKKK